MAKLAGKVSVITGGTTGIGFAVAKRFIEEGAYVIITGHSKAHLATAVQELGSKAVPLIADVRSLSDLDALAVHVKKEFSSLDILFVNAGVGSFAPLGVIDEAFFDNQFDINVKGAFFTVQKLHSLLNEGASVIFNASAVHEKGMATGSVYFATKAAVCSFARSLAVELAPRNIRVNTVSPGLVSTEFQSKTGLSHEDIDSFVNHVKQTTPLGRLGKLEEIAAAVAFLASDEASYVTGEDLIVDGGFIRI